MVASRSWPVEGPRAERAPTARGMRLLAPALPRRLSMSSLTVTRSATACDGAFSRFRGCLDQMVAPSRSLVTFPDTGHPGDQGGVVSACELAIIGKREQLHAAARARERRRLRGVVVERGDGYSGTYRNAWLRIEIPGALSLIHI